VRVSEGGEREGGDRRAAEERGEGQGPAQQSGSWKGETIEILQNEPPRNDSRFCSVSIIESMIHEKKNMNRWAGDVYENGHFQVLQRRPSFQPLSFQDRPDLPLAAHTVTDRDPCPATWGICTRLLPRNPFPATGVAR
jgi:hypothetical protein